LLDIQQIELGGVRIRHGRESRIEVADRQAQVVRGTCVADREIQIAKMRKIHANRGVLPAQHVGVAATRARRRFGESAFEVTARLIHPVRLGLRRVDGRRQEIGCARREGVDDLRGVEAQPSFGEKAVRGDGNHRQQDADQQGG
jgi:hypothetical protein